MNVPKKRKDKMTADDSLGGDSKSELDSSATLVSPRKPIRSYSGDLTGSTSGEIRPLSKLTRLFIHYTLKPRITSRLAIFAGLILLLGIFRDYVLLTDVLPNSIHDLILSFKVADRSWLNMYTVKIGWFWTLVTLVPFMLFTRHELAKRSSEKEGSKVQFFPRLVPCIIRLAVMTLIWYWSVEFFVYYADKDGECKWSPKSRSNATDVSVFDRRQCKKQGHKWAPGFDISGHIFLMLFSNLVRFEEFRYLIKYFEEFIEFRYMKLSRDRAQNYASPYRFDLSKGLTFHLRCFIYLAGFFILTVVWDFMMLQTSLYYHSLSQKAIGFAWAVFSWWATYKVIYPAVNLSV